MRIKVKTMALITRKHNGAVQLMACLGEDSVKQQKFYRLIGGSVEFGESTADALQRELQEELGCTASAMSLVGWAEEVFEYEGSAGHEVTAIYQVTLANPQLYQQDQLAVLDAPEIKIGWIDVAAVKAGNAILYPKSAVAFL